MSDQGQLVKLAAPLPPEYIAERHEQILNIMRTIMKKGVDYDVLVFGQQPSLKKAGAETLITAFSLCPVITSDETFDADCVRQIEYWQKDQSDRRYQTILTKVGYCSVTSKCEIFNKSGELLGCLSGSANSYERAHLTRSVYDVRNNVLKMAEKRALVASVLAVTGASRVFTQDWTPDDQRDVRGKVVVKEDPILAPWLREIEEAQSLEALEHVRERMNEKLKKRTREQGEILRSAIARRKAQLEGAELPPAAELPPGAELPQERE